MNIKIVVKLGCLFTFCYSAWANLLKTKWQTYNLQTGQSISYKYVISFDWIGSIQIAKSKQTSKIRQQFRYLTPIRTFWIWHEPHITESWVHVVGFKIEDTKSNRYLSKGEVFQRILWRMIFDITLLNFNENSFYILKIYPWFLIWICYWLTYFKSWCFKSFLFFFKLIHSSGKALLILDPRTWNSVTGIAITLS